MLTLTSVCGVSSGKLIKVTAVVVQARVIILKLSTSGLAKAEFADIMITNRLNLEYLMHGF